MGTTKQAVKEGHATQQGIPTNMRLFSKVDHTMLAHARLPGNCSRCLLSQ